ncbi:MAG: DUF4268 domain-containing protein [Leeuwenhoekiella sp.]
MLYNTGIKEVLLRFDFDHMDAKVALDLETKDDIARLLYFEKLEQLKTLFESEVGNDYIWEMDYTRPSGQQISRIYKVLPNVNIHRKTDWPKVFEFFYTEMSKLENFLNAYREIISI